MTTNSKLNKWYWSDENDSFINCGRSCLPLFGKYIHLINFNFFQLSAISLFLLLFFVFVEFHFIMFVRTFHFNQTVYQIKSYTNNIILRLNSYSTNSMIHSVVLLTRLNHIKFHWNCMDLLFNASVFYFIAIFFVLYY